MNALVTSNGAAGFEMLITCAPARSQVGSRNAVRNAWSPYADTSATRPSFPAPDGLVTSALPTTLTLRCTGGSCPPDPLCCPLGRTPSPGNSSLLADGWSGCPGCATAVGPASSIADIAASSHVLRLSMIRISCTTSDPAQTPPTLREIRGSVQAMAATGRVVRQSVR